MFEIIVHISSHIHYITYYHDISTAIFLQKPGSQKDPSCVSLNSILIYIVSLPPFGVGVIYLFDKNRYK